MSSLSSHLNYYEGSPACLQYTVEEGECVLPIFACGRLTLFYGSVSATALAKRGENGLIWTFKSKKEAEMCYSSVLELVKLICKNKFRKQIFFRIFDVPKGTEFSFQH